MKDALLVGSFVISIASFIISVFVARFNQRVKAAELMALLLNAQSEAAQDAYAQKDVIERLVASIKREDVRLHRRDIAKMEPGVREAFSEVMAALGNYKKTSEDLLVSIEAQVVSIERSRNEFSKINGKKRIDAFEQFYADAIHIRNKMRTYKEVADRLKSDFEKTKE